VAVLARDLAQTLRPGDQALIMSNGGFGGLHAKLLAELTRHQASASESK
jgi:UDP-N-acetylmuramate: L-alanyl-gamma-D-glutamyl-meso-diaminopimelate ligase